MMIEGPSLNDFMPSGTAFIARAGSKLVPGTAIAGEAAIIAALKTVYDPEIPVDIYELGLIYEVNTGADGAVSIKMSLTAPGCPVAGEMPGMVARAVAETDGVGEVDVELVWDPPWTKDRMSEEAQVTLDMW